MVQPHWERLREMYHQRQFTTERRKYFSQNIINREFIKEEKDFPSVQCFAHGFDFLERNRHADNWLLQIETFDPHEPFHAPARFKAPFDTGWNGPIRDWPRYGRVDELPAECEELRANYYAVVSMCDFLLGQLIDDFDRHGMWKDTALVVTTDHGFLLGEHDFWAKNRMNLYEEIVHIPLFVHDPRRPQPGVRCAALTQTIDLASTFLDLFGVAPPPEMEGHCLPAGACAERPLRTAALFGYFGGAVNITDGRYTYHRFPADLHAQEIFQYTVMPTHIRSPFLPDELARASLSDGFPFTKGAKVLKVPVIDRSPMYLNYGPGALLENDTRLYDLSTDPDQQRPIIDPAQEARLAMLMAQMMAANHAPPEAFRRLDLAEPSPVVEHEMRP
jgi:arylsulfatase A-like enzyme